MTTYLISGTNRSDGTIVACVDENVALNIPSLRTSCEQVGSCPGGVRYRCHWEYLADTLRLTSPGLPSQVVEQVASQISQQGVPSVADRVPVQSTPTVVVEQGVVKAALEGVQIALGEVFKFSDEKEQEGDLVQSPSDAVGPQQEAQEVNQASSNSSGGSLLFLGGVAALAVGGAYLIYKIVVR